MATLPRIVIIVALVVLGAVIAPAAFQKYAVHTAPHHVLTVGGLGCCTGGG